MFTKIVYLFIIIVLIEQNIGGSISTKEKTSNKNIIRYFNKKPIKPKFNITTVNIDQEDEDRRIVRGRPVVGNAYPFIVSLQTATMLNTVHKFCGGTILTPEWIVTAGHCVYDKQSKIWINAGTTNALEYTGSSQVRVVELMVTHPQFQMTPFPINDIALIKLDKKLTFNRFVQAIQIVPESHIAEEHQIGKILGWGSIHPIQHDLQSPTLNELDMNVISSEDCSQFWPIHTHVFCVKNEDGSAGCVGDSGGPFIQKVEGTYLIAGITSYGASDNCLRTPTVYTRIEQYLDFIRSVLAGNYIVQQYI